MSHAAGHFFIFFTYFPTYIYGEEQHFATLSANTTYMIELVLINVELQHGSPPISVYKLSWFFRYCILEVSDIVAGGPQSQHHLMGS